MAIYALGDLCPDIHLDAFVHPAATVIGAVTIGSGATVWPSAVLRADFGTVTIGARTAIEDGVVVHTTPESPTWIGAGCIIGHSAHLEGCAVGDRCLIGSGAIVLNRVTVETASAVGAGALVLEDAVVPSGSIALGVPARCRPAAPDLMSWVDDAAVQYTQLGQRYRKELRLIG
jgi:carbonic anhydrase/acetyltransferase-like protein (isoleucine patch superfamily)